LASEYFALKIKDFIHPFISNCVITYKDKAIEGEEDLNENYDFDFVIGTLKTHESQILISDLTFETF